MKKCFKNEELKNILENHKKWLSNDGGEQANLQGANLQYANLQGANLYGTNLRGANLYGTNLQYANLQGANLYGANLQYANLQGANLYGTNLRGADLCGANLRGADLCGANLQYVRGAYLACPETGSFIAFKKADGCIVTLRVTEDAKRSSATTRKCRCNKAEVLKIEDIETGEEKGNVRSNWDRNFIYKVGKTVTVDDFEEDRFKECAAGIHFFITKQEAMDL
jgi:hypothetical protein